MVEGKIEKTIGDNRKKGVPNKNEMEHANPKRTEEAEEYFLAKKILKQKNSTWGKVVSNKVGR